MFSKLNSNVNLTGQLVEKILGLVENIKGKKLLYP